MAPSVLTSRNWVTIAKTPQQPESKKTLLRLYPTSIGDARDASLRARATGLLQSYQSPGTVRFSQAVLFCAFTSDRLGRAPARSFEPSFAPFNRLAAGMPPFAIVRSGCGD